jgi:hypothetical protein
MKINLRWLGGVVGACGLAAAFSYAGRTVQPADGLSGVTTTSPQAAAQNPLLVLEQNKDANGYIKVHEQGTVPVTGTVNVGTVSGTQNVHVTNTAVPVSGTVEVSNFPAGPAGSAQIYFEDIFPFNSQQLRDIDISGYSKIRVSATVNVSGQVDFHCITNSGAKQDFSVSTAGGHFGTVLMGDVVGTSLHIEMDDPDGEQIILRVWGSN